MGNASRKRRNVETAIAVCVDGLGARCASGEIGSDRRCAGSRVAAPLTAEMLVSVHPRRSSLHIIGGSLCRLHDRVQPIQDRLPLREVGLNLRGRQIEN